MTFFSDFFKICELVYFFSLNLMPDSFHEDCISVSYYLKNTHIKFHFFELRGKFIDFLENPQLLLKDIAFFKWDFSEVDQYFFNRNISLAS